MKHSPSIRDRKEKNRGVYDARCSLVSSDSPKFIVNIIEFLRYCLFHWHTYQYFITGSYQQT